MTHPQEGQDMTQRIKYHAFTAKFYI